MTCRRAARPTVARLIAPGILVAALLGIAAEPLDYREPEDPFLLRTVNGEPVELSVVYKILIYTGVEAPFKVIVWLAADASVKAIECVIPRGMEPLALHPLTPP